MKVTERMDVLSQWIGDLTLEFTVYNDRSESKISINRIPVNPSYFAFMGEPLGFCEEALLLVDERNSLNQPAAGRFAAKHDTMLVQHFPESYGFHTTFSSLSDEKFAELVKTEGTFDQLARRILSPGWSVTYDIMFTKFELLRDHLDIGIPEALIVVRSIKEQLMRELIEGMPKNTSCGHTSDHEEWYKSGLEACRLILNKYDK